ncbi:hypothetical protein SAMN05421504_103409 [Amycolatopsis xylanica]|uniref:Secreted protein n=1 Tax=Amycolatopsis xylanica TaxID=589385 RepID=A0A1H3DL06_9PSEU|nr:choice-of-anchor P family protein [Amycolatopsis xylanica]SDX66324.1 hypothetical protein SAMN05421504_103409 [Amycolatopsis xylanica]
MAWGERTRAAAMAALACGGLVAAPAVANADEDKPPSAWASAGKVDVTVGTDHLYMDSLALCSVAGPKKAKSNGGSVGDMIKYGVADSDCGWTTQEGTYVAVGQARGSRFETSILKQFGGPVITVRTFDVKCSTTAVGSNGYVQFGAVEGFTTPDKIEPNTTVLIEGGEKEKPLAKIVLNEVVVPEPADGSLITTAIHIQLFPEGGPISGDIYAGSAGCDPYGRG